MEAMLRVGPAPAGSTPFTKAGGFDGQGGREIDYGHSFDPSRGYRVFFKFKDSPAANTWGPESLLDWCAKLEVKNDEDRRLKRIAEQQARQCIALNKEWARLGKPSGGVPNTPAGRA